MARKKERAPTLGQIIQLAKWNYLVKTAKKTGEGGDDLIYVPTEAMMPILEAGRLLQRSYQ